MNLSGSRKTLNHSQAGFTLVEIAVAIIILGLSLTALIGLNTSHLTSYYSQKKRVEAAMYAKQLMTFYEIERKAPELGEKSGSLFKELEEKGLAEDFEGLEEQLEGWTYKEEISSVDLPELPDAMRRIDMSVSWGDRDRESFSLIYFVKSPTTNALTSGIAP